MGEGYTAGVGVAGGHTLETPRGHCHPGAGVWPKALICGGFSAGGGRGKPCHRMLED